ncbi:MAG: DUF1858 domain-containing protein [Bacilli bacterium]|nr:DUF1858 domain-containing protein [Bacilli bacterium]
MEKTLDLTKSVKELISQYPEIADIMRELGFKDITNPVMLNTVGRFMTIPKGAKVKNISLDVIKQTFEQYGFVIKE